MNFKTIFALLITAALCVGAQAAGPGGDSSGGGPGGESGGGPGGESGGGPGGESGGGPGGESGGGSGGTLSYDSFISVTTNANCLIREGTLYGWTSSLAASVTPTAAGGVTALADGVFAGNTTITSVNLSNTSIAELPSDCFAGCTALATVVLPSSCTSIGANAFAGCTSLATLTASGVTSIGDDAFRGCTALASVPSSATTLGDYAFAQSGVTAADVSDIASLGEGAFAGCTNLTGVTVATSATLPAAVFAGCTALDEGDWSGVATFGQAALAGIPATAITLDPSATLAAYALAADEATVTTTLSNSSLPTFADDALLGREVSYTPVAGAVTRVEASDLVEWLIAESASSTPTVTQPADYSTATLKTWLATGNNAYLYAYADDLASDADFIGLTVSGTNFVYTAPSDTALSVSVEPVACYTLSSDESDWSADNLAWSDVADAYIAADETDRCFARLRFTFDW